MAFGFRKGIRLAPGVRVNLGRRSLGVSAGPRRAKVSASSSGRRRGSLGWHGLFRHGLPQPFTTFVAGSASANRASHEAATMLGSVA
jgi:hypothetical protein